AATGGGEKRAARPPGARRAPARDTRRGDVGREGARARGDVLGVSARSAAGRRCGRGRLLGRREELNAGFQASPRRDGGATPLFGLDVTEGLRQLPPVASDVLDDAGALAVLPRRQVLDDARSPISSTGKRRIDVGHANL